ncbi:biotin-dependent carboxyltransferase family protein [Winogradskyella sp. R77965]|uniref:biotin-dependent carboxyltransferase family protein n=1 Tax=Winogradskyella sp. R77965 TaxID=3093872 RepID=UPI0037DD7AFA
MIKVLKSGFFTTIQDEGRFGYRQYGIPVSGAMDIYSSGFANALLGNTKDCATIEVTMVGPTLQFLKPTRIVISGAYMKPKLNDVAIGMNSVIAIESNDILSFGRLEKGFRSYLAVKGGFITEKIFESRSMFSNITRATHLSVHDGVDYLDDKQEFENSHAHVKFDNSILNSNHLEVYEGPEFEQLSSEQKNKLIHSEWKVSKLNNRMAYQLEPLLGNSLDPILTAPVLPGTVQLTPKGQLIVLMRDCQTTGGYPRILQLTKKAINVLSQKTTGNSLKISLKD